MLKRARPAISARTNLQNHVRFNEPATVLGSATFSVIGTCTISQQNCSGLSAGPANRFLTAGVVIIHRRNLTERTQGVFNRC